jgi:hypothetical protein
VASRRPEWKGERVQVNVKLSAEAKRMLRALARRRKLPMGEYLEALIREEHRKG